MGAAIFVSAPVRNGAICVKPSGGIGTTAAGQVWLTAGTTVTLNWPFVKYSVMILSASRALSTVNRITTGVTPTGKRLPDGMEYLIWELAPGRMLVFQSKVAFG